MHGLTVRFFVAVTVFAASAIALPVRSAADVDREWLVMVDEDHKMHYVDLRMPSTYVNVNDAEIQFYYHSRITAETRITIDDMRVLANTDFNPQRGTLFIIHGWNNNKDSLINKLLVPATLDTRNWNVFVVDWKEIAYMTYITAKNAVPQVGDIVAKFVRSLVEEHGMNLSHVHLAGHSLGAHVAGRVGSNFKGKIATIVGMDPALPGFNYDDIEDRLDPSDAAYVQVIHTCGGFLGFASPLGHADFYPNGGRAQKGCGLDLFGTCAHSRSYKYFAESIEKGDFIGKQCETYSEFLDGKCKDNESKAMGGRVLDRSASGLYYLETAKEEPFGLGSA